MRSTYLTAAIVALIVVAWIGSGQVREDDTKPPTSIAEQNRQNAALIDDKPPMRVSVAESFAVERHRSITVRGQTRSKRAVEVKSQVGGTLKRRAVERGDRVEAGDLLCEISAEDRNVALNEAKEALNQAKIEFEGSQKLSNQGLQSETAIAQARARLASAEANLKRAELNVDRLTIDAPFAGVIDDVGLELGDFVTPGETCVHLVSLDPMLLTGRVPEKDLAAVDLGTPARAWLANGEAVEGNITFIGKVADMATRTYPVEVQIANADHAIPSGITARIEVPVEQLSVHKISPALLILDDAGRVGVRTVNDRNEVELHIVDVVEDADDGVWVAGLPERVTLITVGQQLVVDGETVEPAFDALGETATPAADGNATDEAASS